ncbi:MAG: RDD family protein [Pseudonocardiales bacterium]|jgi:uncharacterized RDD family membrane protein YckC|nr:RDD family protein [Pseudonocardiales bacterium]
MARWIDGWLPGATPLAQRGAWPGERFGLPEHGVSSVAGFGRRLAALTIDWMLGYLIALLFTGPDALSDRGFSFTVLLAWFVLTAVPTAIFGASAGKVALGIRVASIGTDAVVGVPRAVLRTLLVALVVPPLVRDADGRGWHDRAARTVVVRTRP